MGRQTIWIAVVLAVAMAMQPALVGAQGGSGTGGGSISNIVPTITTFSHAEGTPVNNPSTGTLTGTVTDLNGEGDFATLRITTTSVPSGVTAVDDTRTIVAGDIAQTTDPGIGGDNWAVWNPSATDGILTWEFEYDYAEAGTYVWRIFVNDEGTEQSDAGTDVTVVVQNAITLDADIFGSDGVALSGGTNWGAWSAAPGAQAVGQNFILVTNTGTSATQQLTVSFTGAFTGATTPSETITASGNLDFRYAEGTSSQVPDDLTLTTANDSSGSITLTFSATTNRFWVAYDIDDVGSPLSEQTYTAGYTVNAV